MCPAIVSNCTFSKNTGRVLTFSDFSQSEIKHCRFKENTASDGATVNAQHVKNIYVTDCKFYDNTADISGGGLCIQESALAEITDCTFKGNKAPSGGAVNVGQILQFKISCSEFSENTAEDFGGAILLYNVTGTMENCHFSKNRARYGGACQVSSFAKLDIMKCHFKNNYANLDGGATHIIWNVSLDISNSIFFQNWAEHSGGAISLLGNSTGTIFRCDFACNKADRQGGALLVGQKVLCTISESNFVKNAAEYGGAIQTSSCGLKFTISKCIFDENKAGGLGGALNLWEDSEINVQDTTWVANVASHGGTMCVYGNVRVTVERSNIHRNKAHKSGGVVSVINATVHFMETNFMSNEAKVSGGVVDGSQSSEIFITSCLLSRNHADRGGIFFTQNWGNIHVHNSSLTDNSAKVGGVGIVVNHTFLKIEDSTLANNTAFEAGTLFITKMAAAEISNTTFFNNTASFTGVAHIANGTKVHLKSVTFEGNYETGISWLWMLAYIKPYLSEKIGHIFHVITGVSGVMTVDSLSHVMADGCLFIENSAVYAGVFLVHNSSMTVKNSEFIDNDAQLVGVFEAAYDVQMELSNTSFKGNQARLADIGRILASSNVNITNITVHGTTKNRLHFVNMDVAQESSLRLENSALKNIIGAYYMFRVWGSSHVFAKEVLLENNFLYGISYVSRGSTLTLETCNVTDNHIEDSIITLEDRSTADIRNTSIKDNVLLVSTKGGSLFHVTQNSTLRITQSQFSENFAAKGELILVQDNSSFVIDSCTFANNTAEYGVLLCKSTDFIVFNQSSFESNEAFVSGGVTFSENCVIQVTNSRMARNKAQHYGGCVVSVDGDLQVRKLKLFYFTLRIPPSSVCTESIDSNYRIEQDRPPE